MVERDASALYGGPRAPVSGRPLYSFDCADARHIENYGARLPTDIAPKRLHLRVRATVDTSRMVPHAVSTQLAASGLHAPMAPAWRLAAGAQGSLCGGVE